MICIHLGKYSELWIKTFPDDRRLSFADIPSAASKMLLLLTQVSTQMCSLSNPLGISQNQNVLFCCPVERLPLKVRITLPRDAAHWALLKSRGICSVIFRASTDLCVSRRAIRSVSDTSSEMQIRTEASVCLF